MPSHLQSGDVLQVEGLSACVSSPPAPGGAVAPETRAPDGRHATIRWDLQGVLLAARALPEPFRPPALPNSRARVAEHSGANRCGLDSWMRRRIEPPP